MKTVIIIPTYNAENCGIENLIKDIKNQTVKPEEIFVIDSSSTDNTVEICKKYGCKVKVINKNNFNHGLTRQEALNNYLDYDFAVFMTQDVILENSKTIENLLKAFDDMDVAIAYGRQLTGNNSSFTEKVSRKFNYPETSIIKSQSSIKTLGLHTAFCSDSFACYRVKDLMSIGGFPKTDFAEDMLSAGKLILSGKKVAYIAEARVYHSHKYSIKSEYLRGLAIGRMHRENKWLLAQFGGAEKQGAGLLKGLNLLDKLRFIFLSIPKYAGYIAGKTLH